MDSDKLNMLLDFADIVEDPVENVVITVVDHNGEESRFSPPSRH